ncbi:hypothetical protein J4G33_04675 [Actinotalea sp. BY-33]|uniref:Uncharacterized protein n=1 Tax=Actinotalea soli TaxID=2819234 RepID=A0A939LNY3_9CELL|nr:hypothetical protein [Actinotalea soli]MBO1751093.1 hypothetical protein [Actinotalea soli]
MLMILLRLAQPHADQYMAHLAATGGALGFPKVDPLGIRGDYLAFQAKIAGVSTWQARTLVWGAWSVPLAFLVFVWGFGLFDLASAMARS